MLFRSAVVLLDLRCRGTLRLSISEIILVSLARIIEFGFNLCGKSIKHGPKVGSGGVLRGFWELFGCSGWLLGDILVDLRSFCESFWDQFSLKIRRCFASCFSV